MLIYSSINNQQSLNLQQTNNNNIYFKNNEQFVKNGFTYKSNQILHIISQKYPKTCPYDLLLHISKIYHLNQFEIIFFTHILNQTPPCHLSQPQIFRIQDHILPTDIQQVIKDIYNDNLTGNGIGQELLGMQENNNEQNVQDFTIQELKKLFLYLLVIGYAIKYYLNEPTKVKPYEDYIKSILPNFFPNVFNKWARKHGNAVLSTTPRKINAYYMELGFLQEEEQNNQQKQGEDCQYRNYNQIVQQLIRATTQVDQQGGQIPEDNPQEIEE